MKLPNPSKPKQRTILVVNPDVDELVHLVINEGTKALNFFSYARNAMFTIRPSGKVTDDGLEIWREMPEGDL